MNVFMLILTYTDKDTDTDRDRDKDGDTDKDRDTYTDTWPLEVKNAAKLDKKWQGISCATVPLR